MNQYGIDNVRGGSFCQIILSEANIITIKQMLNGMNDNCFKCGSIEHFAKDCRVNNILIVNKIISGRVYLNVPYPDRKRAKSLGCLWDPHEKKWYCMENNTHLDSCLKLWKRF